MKFTSLQWLVLGAILIFFGGLLLDIADVIAPPNWVWISTSLALWAVSWLVLPSMSELAAARRGSTPPATQRVR